MRLTPNRLVFYAAIADECRYLAEDFNNVTREYGIDLRIDEYADVSVNVKKKLVEVDGGYDSFDGSGYHDYTNYAIYIPFGFIEDPIAWQDQWEEEQQQKTLDKIRAKSDKKKKDIEELEAFDRAEYKRLKEKYE